MTAPPRQGISFATEASRQSLGGYAFLCDTVRNYSRQFDNAPGVMICISDRLSIVNADCFGLLAELPSSAALVTDPPYGIGYVHSGGGKGVGARRHFGRTIQGDDAAFDPGPFLRFRWVLLWGADHFRRRLPEGGTMLAWDKSEGVGPDDSFADGEFAWTNQRVKRNICHYLWKGIACSKAGEEGGRRYHPTQKPQGVCAWSLQVLSLPPGTLVIDPFMGSGSLGVAAHRSGLRYLGIEVCADYFEVAKERLSRAAMQDALALN